MMMRKRAAPKNPAGGKEPAPPRAGEDSVHTLKVTLQGIRPPIWRRIAVPGHFTLGQLHDAIQAAMSWTDSHLHQFKVGAAMYSDPAFELDGFDVEVEDESSITVAEALPRKGSRAVYEYDFGDDWKHLLLVEKVGPLEPGVEAPVCLKGARACPPEDCGGSFGYQILLEALQEPRHPRHQELVEWLGGDLDPEAFSLEMANRKLQHLR